MHTRSAESATRKAETNKKSRIVDAISLLLKSYVPVNDATTRDAVLINRW